MTKPIMGILSGLLALGAACGPASAQTTGTPQDPAAPKRAFVPGVAKDAGVLAQLKTMPDAMNSLPATLPAPATLLPPRPSATRQAPVLAEPAKTNGPAAPPPPLVPKAPVVIGQRKDSGTTPTPGTPPTPIKPATPAVTAPAVSVAPLVAVPLEGRPWQATPLEPPTESGGWLSGLMGGASFYYMKPYISNNTAYQTTVLPGSPTSQVTETPFKWNFAPAAAFWLGWAPTDGIGVRARYFYFDQSSPTLNVSNGATTVPQTTINPPLANFLPLSSGGTAFGSPGTVLNTGIGTDVLAFASTLQIRAFDAEATYGWEGSRWSVLASIGARYEELNQGYHARLSNNGGGLDVNELQLFDATRSFSGGGPVASILGTARIGSTGFSLFGSFRGALLVGTSQERVGFQQTVNDPTGVIPPNIPGTLLINPTASRNGDRVLSVAEFEMGVQYDLQLTRSDLFFRAGAVDHTYFDAGNASQPNGNLSLFGIQFSAGVRY